MLAAILFGPDCADALEAGAAKVEIVAAPGTPLDGYERRMGRGAVAALDSLWVRALYLETEDTTVFLISADLYSITAELRERVLDLVPDEASGAQVILTATHTHNGPGGMSSSWIDRQRAGRFMPDFIEQTSGAFGEAMRGAHTMRKRAVAGYAVTQLESLTENAFSEEGPTDHQLGVIRVEDSDGAPIAVLANFAARAATVSDDHAFVLSADFPGRFCDALESKMDQGAVAFFLNGASGDQVAKNPDGEGDWEWASSFGGRLAAEVQTISESILCRDPIVQVRHFETEFPQALGARGKPKTAVLQSLEIDDLLLAFIPGVAYAEVGLALRAQAKERGYAEHMIVGPANGFAGSLVSYASYGADAGENGSTRFGPGISNWLSRKFSALMARVEGPDPEPPSLTGWETTEFAGRSRVTLRTAPYARGFQRGRAFYAEIRDAYEGLVLEPIRDGKIGVGQAHWDAFRGAVDVAPLTISALANRMRPLAAGLSKTDLEELQGMADATDLPFLGLWLLQTQVYFAEDEIADAQLPEALFVVTEGRTGSDGLLVGHALDEGMYAARHVTEVRPETGQAYIAVGPAWALGVHSGMNEAGLVVCVQRAPDLGPPADHAPPIGFVARSVLTSHVRVEEAVAAFRAVEGLRGYRVLVADSAETDAVVIEFADEVVVSTSEDGLLVCASRDSDRLSSDTGDEIAWLLSGEGAVDVPRVQSALRYFPEERAGAVHTRASVVFETRAARAHVGFIDADGAGVPGTMTLNGDRQ